MSKGLIIGIVLSLLIVVGAGGFFLMKSDTNTGDPGAMSENTERRMGENTGSLQSLKDLMAMSGSQHCVYTDDTASSKGEVFVADGKVRGDFTTTVEDKSLSAHTISDGSMVYVWTDDTDTGFKTDLSALEDIPTDSSSQTANQAMDVNKQLNFNCTGWSVDASKFTPPSDVKFDSYDEMMKSVFEGATPENKAIQCETCDSLPADAQGQCRELLGC